MKKIKHSRVYGSSALSKALEPYSITFNTKDMFAIIEDIGIEEFISQSQASLRESVEGMWNDYSS